MRLRKKKALYNEQGETMLITTLLLLVLVVIVGACTTTSKMQWDMAFMQRSTSNTYYLACSGVEKGTEVLQEVVEARLPGIIEQIKTEHLKKIIDENKLTGHLNYGDNKFTMPIDRELLCKEVEKDVCEFIKNEYADKDISYKVDGDTKKPINVKIKFEVKPISGTSEKEINIICTAEAKKDLKIIDTKTVKGKVKVNIPKEVKNELHEKYEWLYNPAEIVDSALTCFSDVVVMEGAHLIVEGDVRVKGTDKKTEVDGDKLKVPDINAIGGVIASNGGSIKIEAPAPEASHNTGSIYCMNNVLTTNGWKDYKSISKEKIKADYKSISEIEVDGDIVAKNLGIVDDFYKGGANQTPYDGEKVVQKNKVSVKGNVFVDNDVKIEKYVKNSNINIKGSIFGVSDGDNAPKITIGGKEKKDPNVSSGVFNRGVEGCQIKAGGIFVNGQPFIELEEGKPHPLYESIGAPFEDVRSFYKEDDENNECNYNFLVKADNPFYSQVKRDKIKITNENNVYVPRSSYASAIFGSDSGETKESSSFNNKFKGIGGVNQEKANAFFYKGLKDVIEFPSIDEVTGTEGDKGYKKTSYYSHSKDPTSYYEGEVGLKTSDGKTPLDFYFKCFQSKNPLKKVNNHNYKGLRGYMLSKRSVFIGQFNEMTKAPTKLNFGQVIQKLTDREQAWTYENPIEIVDTTSEPKTIELDNYSIEEDSNSKPYSTIIINKGTNNKLTIKGSTTGTASKFKGVIISGSNVEIKGKVEIEGVLIVGGTTKDGNEPSIRKKMMLGEDVGLSLKGSGTNLVIKHNPNVLLEINAENHELYRKVLDALKMTQFKGNTELATILGPYNWDTVNHGVEDDRNPISYTQGRVRLSKKSILEVETEPIKLKIESIKKINK